MSRQDHLRLCAFIKPGGSYASSWRLPEVPADAGIDMATAIQVAKTAERGRFDTLFFPDALAMPWTDQEIAHRHGQQADVVDPLLLASALAPLTKNIGLTITASTTYNEPYHLARYFASLDHLSGGRAGWNLVTSLTDTEAWNFGREHHPAHAERLARAEESYDVVCRLWDSFADDAFLYDKESGRMFDPEKIFAPRHRGEYFEVDGPLTLSRPPQGRPVIAQAGASAGGRRLAARVADLVFAIEADRERAIQQAAELRSLAEDLGRTDRGPLFLPALTVVPGRTRSEAEDAMDRLEATADPKVMLANLSFYLGCDASGFALDEPLPPLPPSNASRSAQDRLVAEAKADNLTVRELALRQDRADTLVGSATEVADHIQEWFETRAADGFTVIPPYLPGALDNFVDLVVPELDRRGLLRPVRDGEMLRDRLGLGRPAHRAPARSALEDA
ncbi:NtaA/DmoA family FMN-dependent monooxygenase [Streptomyces violaceusniger]|uniref:Nitrilotriacetate monooxygenase component A/pristinamycin IIA synthase subunit A n=1 Tax=Streptomyces violaceusniger TaxID=68280 RepID=A0A4D4KSY2_STRVO|nr:nitrilotriacetate monooxygenase component A/pristinamycin IIA synthase subunit A [Streptomyces violaceusniger]